MLLCKGGVGRLLPIIAFLLLSGLSRAQRDHAQENWKKNNVAGVFAGGELRKRSIAENLAHPDGNNNIESHIVNTELNDDARPTSEYYLISGTAETNRIESLIARLNAVTNVRKVNRFGDLVVVLVKTNSAKDKVLHEYRQSGVFHYDIEYSTQDRFEVVPKTLDRLDQPILPLDNSYTSIGTAVGIHLYFVDSGIRLTHDEFVGRGVRDFVVAGESDTPCDFHGSWVAALAAGATLGPASAATVHDLHVSRDSLSCSFYTSDGIDALAWIFENGTLPGVINLSWQGGGNTIIDNIIEQLFTAGYVVVAAAGNANSDVNPCTRSPSRAAYAISVGAIDDTDTKATFSNWGNCVDIWAPGVGVVGASNTGDSAFVTASGTSGSTPVVAGTAAVYYSLFGYTQAIQVTNKVRDSAVYQQLHGIPQYSANNRLVSIYFYLAPQPVQPPNPGSKLSLFF